MDCTQDVLQHRERVSYFIGRYLYWLKQNGELGDQYPLVEKDLLNRARVHDNSKLGDIEKPIFDEVTPLLKTITYGSEEYKATLKKIQVALDHHYKHNPHHPEYWPEGIADMEHVDLVEMLCDWLAAVERHENGDIFDSIVLNQERFGYPEIVKCALWNTALLLQGKIRFIIKPVLWDLEKHPMDLEVSSSWNVRGQIVRR